MNTIVPRKMTNAEKKALERAIRDQISTSVSQLEVYIEATVLWRLHEKYGYDVNQLYDFSNDFQLDLQELKDFYEVDGQEDTELACMYNLRTIGFDTNKLGKAFSIEYTITK